jgi:ankyrin repeat protein
LVHAAGKHEVQLKEMITECHGRHFQWKKTLRHKSLSWGLKWDSPPWNYQDWPSQPSALWVAVAANLVETAKFLLEEASLPQHSENPEIIVASYYGHLQMVELLVEKGADVNATGGSYGSALQAAAARGHAEVVKYLLGNEPDQEHLNHNGEY